MSRDERPADRADGARGKHPGRGMGVLKQAEAEANNSPEEERDTVVPRVVGPPTEQKVGEVRCWHVFSGSADPKTTLKTKKKP